MLTFSCGGTFSAVFYIFTMSKKKAEPKYKDGYD